MLAWVIAFVLFSVFVCLTDLLGVGVGGEGGLKRDWFLRASILSMFVCMSSSSSSSSSPN